MKVFTLAEIHQMSIKWVGTVGLVGSFALLVVLPTALVCGFKLELLALFLLGVLVSYFLFSATEHHEAVQPMRDFDREGAGTSNKNVVDYVRLKRKKAVCSALLAIATWVLYVVTLLSQGWAGWWWTLAILFFLISVVIVLDLAGTVLLDA